MIFVNLLTINEPLVLKLNDCNGSTMLSVCSKKGWQNKIWLHPLKTIQKVAKDQVALFPTKDGYAFLGAAELVKIAVNYKVFQNLWLVSPRSEREKMFHLHEC